VTLRKFFATAAFAAVAVTGTGFPIRAAEPAPTPVAPAIYTFGTLRAAKPDEAKAKSETYLKSVGKFEAAAFAKVWANEARSVFDRTVDSLTLASPEVATFLKTAKNPDADPPAELPKFLTDEKADAFFKANIATAYAKSLSSKRVYEESLEALKAVLPEQVVDPATYYFYKAVSEHSLIQKEQAVSSIVRLLDDVADAPDRYKMVATLMFFDMQNWSADAKDLANIGRLMDNSGRRLDLARGGQKTQDIQKKIVFRLDEKIKELENQAKGKGQGNGGSCPDGQGDQQGQGAKPGNPASDSYTGGMAGEGKVDDKKLKKLAEEWGKLPAAERAKAITEITRDLPPKFKPMIEEYFKSLNKLHNVAP
jgi:tetratricopeptide (TPR) repeat protein